METDNNGVIEFSEKQLCKAFSSIEQRGKKPSESDYFATVNKQLPPSFQLEIESCLVYALHGSQ